MGSAASAKEDATKSTATESTAAKSTEPTSTEPTSTEPTESTQTPVVGEPKAAQRKSTSKPEVTGKPEAAGKRPAARRRAVSTTEAKPAVETADGTNGTVDDAAVEAGASPDDVSPAKKAAAKRKPARPRTRYSVGQQIVYPLQGVGRIERLEEREFQGSPTLYYVVYLEVSDMTIMIPVDKADGLGIRAIVSKRKAERALRLIAEDFDPIPTDWKLRYQMNLDLLKQGAVDDIASVVRSLSYRSRIKELPILERKLYDSALRLMVDEVSYSLGKEKTEIETLIEERLENVKQKGDE